MDFQTGKSTSRLNFLRKQQILISQCNGPKKSRLAKSIDELTTSRSIVGRTDFADFEKLDAMIASALKRLLDKHIHFRKRGSVEEQRAQNSDRFLRGRQNAYMIYEHFRANGAYGAVQGLSDLFTDVCRMTTSKISMLDGIKLCYQRAKYLQMGSWKELSLFSFRLSWLCTIKKLLEIMDKQIIYD